MSTCCPAIRHIRHPVLTSPLLRFGRAPHIHYLGHNTVVIETLVTSKESFYQHFDTVWVMVLQVGAYHATSLLVASRAPTPGVVSRSIGLEGLTSMLAGFWGTGAGASTLTENVHTIAVTKMGSRRPIEFGACILILLSVVGKEFHFLSLTLHIILLGKDEKLFNLTKYPLDLVHLFVITYSNTGEKKDNAFVCHH